MVRQFADPKIKKLRPKRKYLCNISVPNKKQQILNLIPWQKNRWSNMRQGVSFRTISKKRISLPRFWTKTLSWKLGQIQMRQRHMPLKEIAVMMLSDKHLKNLISPKVTKYCPKLALANDLDITKTKMWKVGNLVTK